MVKTQSTGSGQPMAHWLSRNALPLFFSLPLIALAEPAMAQFVCSGEGIQAGSGGSVGGLGSGTGGSTAEVGSFACGIGARAFGGSVASGRESSALLASVAYGIGAVANGQSSIALGIGSRATQTWSLAVGVSSTADGISSIAIGGDSGAVEVGSIAIGVNSRAGVVGYEPIPGDGGRKEVPFARYATAVGTSAQALGDRGTAIGHGALANGDTSVALGAGSVAINSRTVSVGSSSLQRRIVNVAQGILSDTSSDAVVGSQLFIANQRIADAFGTTLDDDGFIIAPSYTIAGATYGDVGGAFTAVDTQLSALAGMSGGLVVQASATAPITVGAGTGGTVVNFANGGGMQRRLTGIAAGTDASDAVNLGQLNAAGAVTASLGSSIESALGGGSSYDSLTGAVSTPTYSIAGTDRSGVGGAFAAVDGELLSLRSSIDGANTNVTNLEQRIDNGAVGLVRRDLDSGAITVAAGFGGTSVNIAGTDGARVLSGVAAGIAETDAVNVGQLNAAIDQVAAVAKQTPMRANNTSGLAQALASGDDALSAGFGSSAAGTGSAAFGTSATASGAQSAAFGQGAQATFAGATAIGAGARAIADPTTAVGFSASATADEASAFGAFATASGVNSTAVGRSATASGTNATSLGYGASASADRSAALGQGTSADHAGSTAVGAGATTDRANQMVLGAASTTYTARGISSAASRASQTGPVSIVTSDAAGNLATAPVDIGAIANIGNRFAFVDSALADLGEYAAESRQEARQGIAAAMAMAAAPMPSAPGVTSWALNTATFRGEWAGSAAFSHRLDFDKPFAINAAYSYSGGSSHGLRFGLAGEF